MWNSKSSIRKPGAVELAGIITQCNCRSTEISGGPQPVIMMQRCQNHVVICDPIKSSDFNPFVVDHRGRFSCHSQEVLGTFFQSFLSWALNMATALVAVCYFFLVVCMIGHAAPLLGHPVDTYHQWGAGDGYVHRTYVVNKADPYSDKDLQLGVAANGLLLEHPLAPAPAQGRLPDEEESDFVEVTHPVSSAHRRQYLNLSQLYFGSNAWGVGILNNVN